MGGEDEVDRPTTVVNRRGRRQGNGTGNNALYPPERSIRPGIHQAGCGRLEVEPAVGTPPGQRRRVQQQDEIYLLVLRPECLGQTRPRHSMQAMQNPNAGAKTGSLDRTLERTRMRQLRSIQTTKVVSCFGQS